MDTPAVPAAVPAAVEQRTTVALLRAGDVLPGSGERVTVAPYRDIRTPAGKVELVVENTRGRARAVTWGARTPVWVSRA